jgi:hypothetical protein
MKNIKWVIHSYWSAEDLRYLINDTVSNNFVSTVGAFVSAPVTNQAFEVLLKKFLEKIIILEKNKYL